MKVVKTSKERCDEWRLQVSCEESHGELKGMPSGGCLYLLEVTSDDIARIRIEYRSGWTRVVRCPHCGGFIEITDDQVPPYVLERIDETLMSFSGGLLHSHVLKDFQSCEISKFEKLLLESHMYATEHHMNEIGDKKTSSGNNITTVDEIAETIKKNYSIKLTKLILSKLLESIKFEDRDRVKAEMFYLIDSKSEIPQSNDSSLKSTRVPELTSVCLRFIKVFMRRENTKLSEVIKNVSTESSNYMVSYKSDENDSQEVSEIIFFRTSDLYITDSLKIVMKGGSTL